MKKLFQPRTVSLIIIVAALIPLRAEVAQAQSSLPDLGVNYDGRTVVFTGKKSNNTVTYCDLQFTEYDVVITPWAQSAPAIRTVIAVQPEFALRWALKAGDRFKIDFSFVCNGRFFFTLFPQASALHGPGG